MTDHDTREKLEADMRNMLHSLVDNARGYSTIAFRWNSDTFITLLDRQAAITERERERHWLQDERDELLEMLDEKDELLGSATRNLDESLDDLKDMGDHLTDMENQRDELQAKLDAYDKTHMELPLDADGVPIRVGDKMQYHGGEPFTVCAVAPGVIHTWAAVKLGERKTTYDYAPIQCTHYKPRTVEDVLAEFAGDVRNGKWSLDMEQRYADELRELIGGDA